MQDQFQPEIAPKTSLHKHSLENTLAQISSSSLYSYTHTSSNIYILQKYIRSFSYKEFMHSAIKFESSMLKSNLRRKKYYQLTWGNHRSIRPIHFPLFSSLFPWLSLSLPLSLSLCLFQSPSTLRPSLSRGGNEALSLYTQSVKGNRE